MRSSLLIMIFYSVVLSVSGQDYPRKNIDQSRLAEELFGFQDQDINYEELYENMMQLISNPIDINLASQEELRFLNILTEAQIQSLIKYRTENGDLISIYELQSIPDFDIITINKFIPFVEVTNHTSQTSAILKRALMTNNNYFIARYQRTLETKAGYNQENTDRKFKGSPDQLYYRFRTSKPGDFSFGFTTEKDAGEQFKWNTSSNQYGFDFLSAHAQVMNKGRLKNLIIGDYQNQFGQGLMLGGIFGFGKGAETITTTRRSNLGSLPFTSVNEFGMLRGAAATYEVAKNIFLSGFYSRSNRDASITENETETAASSFQMSGLHRNESELLTRKKIHEQNYGGVLQYRRANIDIGLMYNFVGFDKPLYPKKSLYNQFAFNGLQNQNMGFYFNYTYSNFLFFGEYAKSFNGGAGRVAGIIGSLTPSLDISLLYRKYDRDFHTFFSNAFAEGTTAQNESGIYWGWKYHWNRKFSFAGYVDMFRFPWLRFRSYKPSEGHEWLLRFNYQPSKNVLIYIQAREEKKIRNTDDPNLYVTANGVKHNYWINCDYGLTQKLKLKTRAQFSTYNFQNKTTSGLALIQDISYEFGKFEITARHALFDTDDYDNRQYTYEKDVWLAYSLPAYYGEGVRNFILLEYKVHRNITIWFRYARTRYTDREEIGSGVDRITGNVKNDIKFQLRLRL